MSHPKVPRVKPERSSIVNSDPLLQEAEAATYLGLAWNTLSNWRHARHPDRTIPYVKLGGRVLYRKSALDTFISRREHGPVAVND